jgi:G3E family GTPase
VTATPFTILTGFLGAGKTTVLNRVLADAGGRRIAVLVNELGRIDIDSRLIIGGGGDVLELAGGCLCCKVDVKNDLWDGIGDIISRSRPDHVVLETTGIAEPPAIAEGLERTGVREMVEPAGVVCVLDATVGAATLASREEARIQVEHADRILVSKLDLADAETVAASHRAARALNDAAERASFPPGTEATAALIGWLLARRPLRRVRDVERAHRHGQLAAATFVDAMPLAGEPLLSLMQELAPGLLRVKGFVHLAGEERRGFLELASGRVALSLGEPWGDAARRTELVVIGEDVTDEALRRQLWACAAM